MTDAQFRGPTESLDESERRALGIAGAGPMSDARLSIDWGDQSR